MPLAPALGALGAPGVFVTPPEPVRTLTGVRRDIAAFVGVAPRGPAFLPVELLEPDDDLTTYLTTSRRQRSIPIAVTSWDEYRRIFGSFEGPGRLPYAVAAYFAGGGELAHVVRIVHDHGDDGTNTADCSRGVVVGLTTTAGADVGVTARSEGSWGDRVRATLRFDARPLAVEVDGLQRLIVDRGNWVPGGTLLRLALPADARALRYVDSSIEEPVPDGPGLRRVLTLDAPTPAPPTSVEIVSGQLDVIDVDPTFPRREVLADLGFRNDHPRWLGRVIVDESDLLWPETGWSAATLDLTDPSLPPFELGGFEPWSSRTMLGVRPAGDRFSAVLAFSTAPLAAVAAGPRRLTVGAGETVPVGTLLRLGIPGRDDEFRFVDSDVEEGMPGGGTHRVLHLDADIGGVPDSVELVIGELAVSVIDADGTRTDEFLLALGLRDDHPRWLGLVVENESTLLEVDAGWSAAPLKLPDVSLNPVELAGFVDVPHLANGRDRWDRIVPEDFWDHGWVPGDEVVGGGVHCLGEHDDVGLLVAPDLYDPDPIAEVDHVADSPTLCGSEFAVHVETADPPPPDPPAPGLAGLALDPRVPGDLDRIVANQRELVRFAELRREFTVLLDVPLGLSHRQALTWRTNLDSPFAAAYHPWLDVAQAEDRRTSLIRVNPSAFAAAIIAERELRLGVQHGPANEIAVGVVRVSDVVPPERHDELHVAGVNVFQPVRDGVELTGARTLTCRPILRQLSVARLMTVLRLTLEREMTWAVFEPNNRKLRSEVRRLVHGLLTRLYAAGAFRGATTQEAFFVRCDRTTMTQNDLDNGRLICLVGVAPAEPIEYLVLEIALATDVGVSVEVAT